MTKKTSFPTNAHTIHGQVAYLIKGDLCYFTGVGQIASTINLAENVITAIAEREGIHPGLLRFFDIQCRSGYERYLPGQFTVNELVFEMTIRGVRVKTWTDHDCPPEIIKEFRKFIGPDLDLKNKYLTHQTYIEGLMAVMDKAEDSYHVDEQGNPAYPARYVDVTEFKNGYAYVLPRGTRWWQKIDKGGQVVETRVNPIDIF